MKKINNSAAWQKLTQHAERLRDQHLRDLFAEDRERFQGFSLTHGDLLVDFSKQRIEQSTLNLLHEFAEFVGWQAWRERMYAGEAINHTEGRSVGHWRLRAGSGAPSEVQEVLDRMARFCNEVHSGVWRGYSGKPITDVVNLGIGGSDLGPRMVVQALAAHWRKEVRIHFVANLDGADLALALQNLDPASTLFVVASKTFTTQETMTNARTARDWLMQKIGDDSRSVSRHFAAASCNTESAEAFGIAPENVFPFADWVGGRFSLCSSVGLSIALAIGFDGFERLLAGARNMDEHFLSAPASENIPLVLALLGFWNGNFLGARSQAIFPYSHSLRLLPAYLQQLEMESNGKRVDRDGERVDYVTNPVIWGESGTNGQHSFFQLLHQGGELLPSDFIVITKPDFPLPGHHEALLANCLAQSSALAFGKSETEVRSEGVSEALIAYRSFPGNQPSTTIVLSSLDPFSLGQLIALYEHKVFCLGVLWNLNSFDQWGVELGKQLAGRLLPLISGGSPTDGYDSSTGGMIEHLKGLRSANSSCS